MLNALIRRTTKWCVLLKMHINGRELLDKISVIELDDESKITYAFDRELLDKSVCDEVEIEVKYEGYIKIQQEQVDKFKNLEKKVLPIDFDYENVKGISLEARQKLNKFKPLNLGQASRISGISPADISVLLIFLEQLRGRKNNE